MVLKSQVLKYGMEVHAVGGFSSGDKIDGCFSDIFIERIESLIEWASPTCYKEYSTINSPLRSSTSIISINRLLWSNFLSYRTGFLHW